MKKIIAVMGATGTQGGGLVRAILNDQSGNFAVRAITRDVNSEKAKALAALGAEVVAANLDDVESLRNAFQDAYGAYCVTFYWDHFSPETETSHVRNMAEAAQQVNVKHVVWSTLEDTRKWIPLDDDRMPTLMGNYKVPHFDAKGAADRYFIQAGVPTTFLMASFYWDNMIYFGMGPKAGEDGTLAFTVPMADKKLAGIAAQDIGKCAYGIFKGGPAQYAGKFIGLSGDHLTGTEMAAALTKAMGRNVRYNEVSPAIYRNFGFPGADDLGNMFQFYAEFEQICLGSRDLEISRSLNKDLLTFEQWLDQNKSRIPLES